MKLRSKIYLDDVIVVLSVIGIGLIITGFIDGVIGEANNKKICEQIKVEEK